MRKMKNTWILGPMIMNMMASMSSANDRPQRPTKPRPSMRTRTSEQDAQAKTAAHQKRARKAAKRQENANKTAAGKYCNQG